MTLPDPTEHELYDLLLVGLSWMRQDKPEQPDRTCASIVRALWNAGALSVTASRTLATNAKLVGLIMGNMVTIQGRGDRKKRLNDAIETSECRLAVLVPSSESFVSVGLVGRRGYGIAVTARGMAYAEQVSPNYAEHVTHAGLREGWIKNRAQMGAIHATPRQVSDLAL